MHSNRIFGKTFRFNPSNIKQIDLDRSKEKYVSDFLFCFYICFCFSFSSSSSDSKKNLIFLLDFSLLSHSRCIFLKFSFKICYEVSLNSLLCLTDHPLNSVLIPLYLIQVCPALLNAAWTLSLFLNNQKSSIKTTFEYFKSYWVLFILFFSSPITLCFPLSL